MESKEIKEILDSVASELLRMSDDLEKVRPYLKSKLDKKVVSDIITDLHWGCENCTTVGLHQIGKALDDKMGCDKKGD